MLDIFSFSFMVRALIAGLIIAVVVPVLGSFLVARRYSLIADSLAHVSLTGVGAGLLAGVMPIAFAVPVTVAGALILEWLRQKQRISGEIALAILMSSGLALAVVLANLAQGLNADFSSYLFGSITTTTQTDLVILAVAATVVLTVITLNYRTLLYIAFDEDGARIAGYKVSLLNYTLAAMTAVIVVLSLQVVGGLLMSALLVMPVVAASRFADSFLLTIVIAILFAALAVISGLVVAFYLGIAAGGSIVLAALALLIGSLALKK
ncbi:MAG TPA: metal ABC transporter permease [Candidatus Saccharimonadales bacterium]|nr:metal ABC transporter permease [Candidatus Saccharimonadales bacterium]